MNYWQELSGTGLEWHPKSSHPYVRNFVLMFWNLVKDDRSQQAYKIAQWFYGVDWMKFQIAAEWNCEVRFELRFCPETRCPTPYKNEKTLNKDFLVI